MVQYNNNFDNTKPFSDQGFQIDLVAGIAITVTVPGTRNLKYRAEFSFTDTSNVWVARNQMATVPTSGLSTATNQQEFRPRPRYVDGADTVSFITSDTGGAQCGVVFFQLPSTA